MRIERLIIDGFGHFSGCTIGPLDRRLTVLSGPNEAGKSTLLAFIRTILFGFPIRGRSEFYPPLAGGRHGGRIELVGDDGARLLVERTSGPRGGHLQITSGSGERLSGAADLKRLVGHASQSMFNAVFAFDLDELNRLGSLNESEVSGRIYSAGMGASRLPETLKDLERRRDKLFKPGGSRHEVAGILRELQEIESALDAARNDAVEYRRLVERREAIEPELEQASAEVERLTARWAELQRLRQGWEDWVETTQLEERLKTLPAHEGFPPDGLTQLQAAEERLERERQELADAREHLEAAEKEASVSIEGERLLEDEESVGFLRRNLGRFEAAAAELTKHRKELERQQQGLDAGLRDLGTGWDESRLPGFDTSLPVRTALEEWAHRLAEAEQALRQAHSDKERAEQELEDARELSQESRHELESAEPPPFDASELERRRDAARVARSRLDAHRGVRQRREDLQKQMELLSASLARQRERTRRRSTLWLPIAALGLVAAAVGLALGGDSTTFGLALGLVLILLAGATHLFGRGDGAEALAETAASVRSRLDAAKQEELRARRALDEAVTPLGEEFSEPDALDAVEASLEKAAKALEGWSRFQEDVERTERELERRRHRAEDAEEKERSAREALERVKKGWAVWLAEHGLEEKDLSPTAAIQVFSRIEKAQLQLESLEDTRRRLRETENEIDRYRSRLTPLAQKHAFTLKGDHPSAAVRAAEHLGDELERVRSQLSRREQARETAQKARRDVDTRKRHLAEAEELLTTLLRSAGAVDPEAFRRMAAEHADRKKLEDELRKHATKLRLLSGTGEAYERFHEALSGTTAAALEEESRRVAQKLETAKERKEQLYTERGGVLKDIERLTGGVTASELRARRAVLVERLETAAREWSVLTLARSLLEQARFRYEQERQPGVLKSAERFFETVTGGAYTRLLSPLDSETVTVIAPNGSKKTPEQLSRGTREQLYLALRFGLIRQFAEQETSLPVIVDEVLVNFDPQRARKAAQGFAELARTNQVLVFTCHPNVVELFTDAEPDTKLIDLTTVTRSDAPGE